MIEDIVYCLPKMAMGNIEMLPSVAESYAERLKSLRPIKQEWSEEDEKMREGVIALLEAIKIWILTLEIGCANNPSPWLIDQRINWFKALRPSWKPSEKQMKALSNSIEYCKSQANIGYYLTVGDIPLLEQLAQQLNKLM